MKLTSEQRERLSNVFRLIESGGAKCQELLNDPEATSEYLIVQILAMEDVLSQAVKAFEMAGAATELLNHISIMQRATPQKGTH